MSESQVKIVLKGELLEKFRARVLEWEVDWESEGYFGSQAAVIRYLLRRWLEGDLIMADPTLTHQVKQRLEFFPHKYPEYSSVEDVVNVALQRWLEEEER